MNKKLIACSSVFVVLTSAIACQEVASNKGNLNSSPAIAGKTKSQSPKGKERTVENNIEEQVRGKWVLRETSLEKLDTKHAIIDLDEKNGVVTVLPFTDSLAQQIGCVIRYPVNFDVINSSKLKFSPTPESIDFSNECKNPTPTEEAEEQQLFESVFITTFDFKLDQGGLVLILEKNGLTPTSISFGKIKLETKTGIMTGLKETSPTSPGFGANTPSGKTTPATQTSTLITKISANNASSESKTSAKATSTIPVAPPLPPVNSKVTTGTQNSAKTASSSSITMAPPVPAPPTPAPLLPTSQTSTQKPKPAAANKPTGIDIKKIIEPSTKPNKTEISTSAAAPPVNPLAKPSTPHNSVLQEFLASGKKGNPNAVKTVDENRAQAIHGNNTTPESGLEFLRKLKNKSKFVMPRTTGAVPTKKRTPVKVFNRDDAAEHAKALQGQDEFKRAQEVLKNLLSTTKAR
jgi:hypothetical protein